MNIYSATLRLRGLLLLLTAHCLLLTSNAQTVDYTKWVNPFIGTGGHGHTFPGATMPFGMVQLSPDTRTDNWDGSSGYHYSDDVIYGFSHTHLSGTGIPDYCDILVRPVAGNEKIEKADAKGNSRFPDRFAPIPFSHTDEKAEPGFYTVNLGNGVLAEMTATPRVGLHRYTFRQSDDPRIAFDLEWRDKVLDSQLKVVNNRRIEGFRRSTSWAKDQIVYFVAEFSKPIDGSRVEADGMEIRPDGDNHSKDLKAIFFFKKTNEPILLKVALSPVSIEGARKNLAAELPGWDFDKVRSDAKAAWNKELSKIEVSGGTDAQTTTFYTALYHTMIQPNIFNDVDGNYRGMDGKVHQLPGYESRKGEREKGRKGDPTTKDQRTKTGDQYTVFSLWDTFRAAHPLYTIIDQKRTVDFINTFIRQYEQGGRLPVWELAGNETDTMIGYHAVSVIADAMAKGITGFDYEKAYAAAKHSAELDHFGLAAYKRRGYISMEDENESVSKTLEYAYDDWCIAQMQAILNRRGGIEEIPPAFKDGDFRYRARYFENLFDPATGFMRPKKNGGFISPFAPNEVTFNYTEGNAWVYSFFVPQDITRLMELMGGREKFAAKLDELFTTKDKLAGREQPDITGLIGQYAHGNEPSHHIAYLYDYAGQPWKTQKLVRKIMDEFYKPEPDGLIGNEDCGQMSAWYVMSASGFYEVTPGSGTYVLGTPLFKEVKYHLENGAVFTIKAPNVSPANLYIRSAKMNGQTMIQSYFDHVQLMKGGVIEFEMTDAPVEKAFPWYPSSDDRVEFVAMPSIHGGSRVFGGKATISIQTAAKDARIYYSTDGTTPTVSSKLYSKPFTIDSSTRIKAVSYTSPYTFSFVAEAEFLKKPNDWTVSIASKYNRQYTGGGDEGLIDGIRGTVNFASGEWQGYQGQDFVATVDLQRETTVSEVGGGFLQNARSWIWMPTHIEFETSMDGVNFTRVADIKTDIAPTDMEPKIRDYTQTISPVQARYVRAHAYNLGKIPAWHPGAGDEAFIFVDEVMIK